MVRIDLSKVVGNDGKHSNPSLPLFSTYRHRLHQRWRLSYVPFAHRATFWAVFICLAIATQCIAFWRLVYYEPPLPPAPPYNVNETVSLISKYYGLLRDMNYIAPQSITFAPEGGHAINISLASRLGLDELVIETIQKMPYINSPTDILGSSNGLDGWATGDRFVFWRDGRFVDYRKDDYLWWSRDPLSRERFAQLQGKSFLEKAMLESEALPKSAIPLSIILPNFDPYGIVLVLDTASNRIVVLDTQGSGCKYQDPFFNQFESDRFPRQYKVPGMFYGNDDCYGRLVPDLLRDFIISTASLQSGFVPGSVRPDPYYTPELSPPKWEGWVRNLYEKSGWPNRETMENHLFPNRNSTNTTSNPLVKFESSSFKQQMHELRHIISVRYLDSWYCPVPRNATFINLLEERGALTPEQIAYARSDEEVIPLNLEG
ncbi:hypothetical protein F5884DRAFT_781711 [Xylogone sp. PMI_703]|nr:hypothetical protein F5884DRAFT_781711 [Xylogone sp. PMI_703]